MDLSPATITGICTALAVPIGGLWVALKFYISRVDIKEAAELDREEKEREKDFVRQDRLREELRRDMQARIDELIKSVKLQGATINGLYGHIRKLEQKMAAAGLEIPALDIEEILRRMPA